MECEYDFIKELEGKALDYLNYHNIGQNDFDSCNTFYNIYDEECSDDYDYYEANQHEAHQTDCFKYENFYDNLDYENEREKNLMIMIMVIMIIMIMKTVNIKTTILITLIVNGMKHKILL